MAGNKESFHYKKIKSSNKTLVGCRKNEFIERVHADAARILKHSRLKVMPHLSVVGDILLNSQRIDCFNEILHPLDYDEPEECDRERSILWSRISDLQRANETPVEKSLELMFKEMYLMLQEVFNAKNSCLSKQEPAEVIKVEVNTEVTKLEVSVI